MLRKRNEKKTTKYNYYIPPPIIKSLHSDHAKKVARKFENKITAMANQCNTLLE